jgi:uncharacterized membrane protein
MLIFKVLHILSMFIAVTFLMGDAFFLALAFWRRDLRALATFQRLVGARPLIGSSIFLLGIVFGLLTAATGDIDFFRGWLVAAYVLVAAALLVNVTPFVQRMPKVAREALEVEAGGSSAEDVARRMSSVRTGFLVSVALNAAIFVALIVDMVVKPF